MYLSRLLLNPFSSRVRHDLSDCQGMHRTVMSGFPDHAEPGVAARQRYGILYRLDVNRSGTEIVLLVQSQARPDWRHVAESGYLAQSQSGLDSLAVKSIDEQIARIDDGMTLRFRLRANPTRKTGTSSKSDRLSGVGRSNGRRVFIETSEEQIAWLARKGNTSGFELIAVQTDAGVPDVITGGLDLTVGVKPVSDRGGIGGSAVTSHRLMFRGVVFDGHLRVTDRDAFRAALASGIGSGKAYGFGLLSVGPA